MADEELVLISDDDLNFISTVLASGVDLYRAYDRMLPYLEPGSDRYFWFQQASIINQQATGSYPPSNTNLSSTYILVHSGYGLALDGHTNDLSITSNAIAAAVLGDIISNNGILPLEIILQNDISQALIAGNQTIGGWGGSFYYWDLPYQGSTIGQIIQNSPQDLEKFLLSSAVATVAVLFQEGNETPTLGEIQTVVGTALGSSLPLELKSQISLIALDAILTGQFVADVDHFGQWTYNRSTGEFYYVIPPGHVNAGEVVVATGAELQFLEERRAYRLQAEELGLDYTFEVIEFLAMAGLVNFIPIEKQCFAAGTPVNLPEGATRPIESIHVGDTVVSYTNSGTLVPGRVTRTFRNEVSHLLDVHGLKATPGHVTLCGDGIFMGRHVPIIDILLSDGALVTAEGALVRIATNQPMGSIEDRVVKVLYALTADDARSGQLREGGMRVGTLLFDREGVPVSVLDCLTAEGLAFDPETGLVAKPGEAPHPLHWFGTLPRPEDYILTRSRETLEGILVDGEWEGSKSELIVGRLRQTAGVIN